MTHYNVLILSAGRRVELVQKFQEAAKKLQIDSTIIAADCSNTAPALFFADKAYKLPRISEPNYIQSIIEACNKEGVSLIVPTIDTDLLLLAENKKKIELETQAKVLISDYRVVEICRDKVKTQKFLLENKFGVPGTYDNEELSKKNLEYPLFIKPKSGSSSINAYKVNNSTELEAYKHLINDYMVQEYIEGTEFTVDVFLDFDGNIITVVPRQRLATRSGEISKGKIIKDREVIDDVKKLMKVLKPIGHITVQLMKTSKGIQYIEINPRFGGGAPMSIQSGADSCENLYRLLLNQKLEYNEAYSDLITFLRFDSSICIDDNMELVK